ncbi:MAG: hypothetical protein QY326_03920 [Bdellovibrionota bacterium]|nr:MAG: hypothetical protein QY326_03920 [Bdellovibrionota bacterium]
MQESAPVQSFGWVKILTLLVFAALLVFPMTDAWLNIIPRARIHGMAERAAFPTFTPESWWNQKYQARFSQWALKSGAFWSWSIRLSNELVYRLTGEISTDYGTSVQGGNESYLWQMMYKAAFNRVQDPPRNLIRRAFTQFKELKEQMAARNIPVVAVINPNLIFMYPELLPDKYHTARRMEKQSSYEVAQEVIKELDAPVVDAAELLKSVQDDFPFRFFEPAGSHWNDIGSCIAARAVLRELDRSWGRGFPALPCEDYEFRPTPEAHERDLVQIANLLFPERLFRPTPYVRSRARQEFPERKPKLLLIGTSFLFGLEKQFRKHFITDDTRLLFYYRQERKGGKGNFRNFAPSTLNWSEVLSMDGIILDINESGPAKLGYGFMRDALRYFDSLKADTTASERKKKKKRKGMKTALASIELQAEQRTVGD